MSLLFVIVSLVSIIVLTAQGTLIKLFGDKRPGAEITYTLVSSVCALILFGGIAIFSSSQYNPQSLLYSLFFAVCYAGSTITFVLAVNCGSLALTSTIHSFALIIPTVLGFLIWNEPVSTLKIIGIVLFAVSLLLIGEKVDKSGGQKLISAKWLVLMVISFFCEGFAPVAIKMHSIALGEKAAADANGVFMALAYVMAVVGILVAALLTEGRVKIPSGEGKKPKNFIVESLKIALPFAALGGVCNGLYNFMNTVVSNNNFNVSVFFPVISAGQLIFTLVIAMAFFKEKLSLKQLFAIGFGIVAIVLLNV